MRSFLSLLAVLSVSMLFLPTRGEAFLLDEWAEILVGEDAQKIRDQSNPPTQLWEETLSGMTFIFVKGGCYKMGSPPYAHERDADEDPVHRVCLSDFWMGKKEVTQAQWRTIMHSNPAYFQKGDRHPVERVDHDEVLRLTQRLNKLYNGKATFRLPTEAEWEYVCRDGGLREPFPGSHFIDKLGFYRENSSNSTQPTGTLFPNRLGFHDLSGNVWEWVQDSYDRLGYGKHQTNSPVVETKGLYKVIRGGSWREGESALRCANRGFEHAGKKRPDIGVRLVVMVKAQEKKEPLPDINVIPF
ncbi:MAG: formylglycine-generating enzyme family protein [Magnetococcales bacterium]|nr:formylglycine-generating enzyme family protein [Magnetococcales bacterium]